MRNKVGYSSFFLYNCTSCPFCGCTKIERKFNQIAAPRFACGLSIGKVAKTPTIFNVCEAKIELIKLDMGN